jgi:Leucine-rich repeat (LRR) protein
MHRLKLLFILVLLCRCSVDTQLTGGSSETETGAMLGKVVNRDSTGIGDVQVTLNSVAAFDSLNLTNYFLAGWNTVTDFNGRFMFVSLTTGRYAVAANYHDTLGGMAHVDVSAGETTQVTITLLPMGVIRGTIDPNIMQLAPRGLYVMVLDLPRRVMVDRAGAFEIKPLPAGDYTIRFMSGDSVFADVPVHVNSGEVTTLCNYLTVEPPVMDSTDSANVRTILDTNGLSAVAVRLVADMNAGGRITALDLTSRGCSVLPSQIGRLSELRTLKIGGNRLTSLPDSLGELSRLELLVIGQVPGSTGNTISPLPASLGRLTNLKSLDLRGQSMNALPDWIGRLRRLAYLDLSYNLLSSLCDSLGRCDSLQELRIEYNQHTTLPAVVGSLKKLQTLWAGNNPLSSVAPELAGCENLRWLYLEYCFMDSLPSLMLDLPALLGLYLSSNRLTSLPDSGWQGSSITRLYVTDNLLTALPGDIITLTPTMLSLAGNALCGIPDSLAHWADCYDREWRASQTCPGPQWTLWYGDNFDRADGALGTLWQTIDQSLPRPAIFQGLVRSMNPDTTEQVRFTNAIGSSPKTRISIDLKWPSTDSVFGGLVLRDSAGNIRYRLILKNTSADPASPMLTLCFSQTSSDAIVNYQQVDFDSTFAQGRIFGDHTLTLLTDGSTITGSIAFHPVVLAKIELPFQPFTVRVGLVMRGSDNRPLFADSFKVEVLQ